MNQLAQTLALGLLIGGVYALLASGLTLVFGVMNVINVAHGAFLIFAAFLTWSVWKTFGIDPLALILLTTPAMFLIGWILYKTTIQKLRGARTSMSVLLTFALALVLEGIMGLIWTNVYHSATPAYFTQSLRIVGLFIPSAQLYACIVAVGVLGILYALLAKTWMGRALRAASENPQSARLVGVNVESIAALAFGIGAATAGAGGAVASVLYPFLPGSHHQWISRLLGIIILGGMGSLPGAVLGAMSLGVAETMTATYVGLDWATAVPYAIILVVLLVRPQGIMGTRLREDVAL